ncbi:hypothetical protein AVEN_247226-1 [Araneus ventricosus]|uniref:Uncharacterized protein n=1 Tax=Araneus ventricosus TaxID=182803 RepID=A0A4Y2EUD6_ARAVE|nr:hypothetical protein AVEN_247226-1 [Araneus ventricosus]
MWGDENFALLTKEIKSIFCSETMCATCKGNWVIYIMPNYGVYYGTPLWVGFRTLTTEPNPNGGTRIDPYVSKAYFNQTIIEESFNVSSSLIISSLNSFTASVISILFGVRIDEFVISLQKSKDSAH